MTAPPAVRHAEAGATAIELLVAMVVMAIALSTAMLIVSAVSRTSNASDYLGRSSQSAQVELNQLMTLLSSTTAPNTAYLASGLANVKQACWGWATGSGATDPSGGSGNPGTQAGTTLGASDQSYAILVADPYEFEFCGYRRGQSAPHVFDVKLNTAACVGAGYCPLQVIDYGQYGDSTGSVVSSLSIPNVWCDHTYCQSGVVNSGGTPALFTYWTSSGQSQGTGDDSSASNYANVPGIGMVRVQVTVLARTTNTNLAVSNGNPGTTLTDQACLLDLGC
jgi:hypothetical protein